MTDLYPTKTRLELLREVASSKVKWWPNDVGDDDEWACWYSDNGGDRKVTARMNELEAAGWVHKGPVRNWTAGRVYEVTDTGAAILRAHPEASNG